MNDLKIDKNRISREIKKYGLYITTLQFLRSVGLIAPQVVYDVKDKKYYSKLTREEQYADLAELYTYCGLDDDISNPSTFTGKLQWMKFNEDLSIRARLSDKYLAKEWVKELVGEKYIIPTIGVWDDVDDIPFNELPDQVVLKANHGSGMNYIIKDKSTVDWNKAKKKLNRWLKTRFGWNGMELQYHLIERKILAETYISETTGNLLDYKVHCFNGVPTFIQVIGDRIPGKHYGRQANYDFDWNRLPWVFEDYPAFDHDIHRPEKLNEIYEVSKILSSGFPYVRVDLYFIKDEVKFGEMTFTPGIGMYPYKGTWTRELDLKYGSMIHL